MTTRLSQSVTPIHFHVFPPVSPSCVHVSVSDCHDHLAHLLTCIQSPHRLSWNNSSLPCCQRQIVSSATGVFKAPTLTIPSVNYFFMLYPVSFYSQILADLPTIYLHLSWTRFCLSQPLFSDPSSTLILVTAHQTTSSVPFYNKKSQNCLSSLTLLLCPESHWFQTQTSQSSTKISNRLPTV